MAKRKKAATGTYKRKRKAGSKRKSTKAQGSLEKRVKSLEHFRTRQKEFNRLTVSNFRHIYEVGGIARPRAISRMAKTG